MDSKLLKKYASKVSAKKKKRSKILEKDIEKPVSDHAKSLGVMTRKFTSPAHPSVPDHIYFFDSGITVLIEIKRTGEKLTYKQACECRDLLLRGHYVYTIDSIWTGIGLIDFYQDCAARGYRPPRSIMPTEQQWQRITHLGKKAKGKRISL